MEIGEEKSGEVKIIRLTGRLDANTSIVFESRLRELLNQGERQIVFDFANVSYVSSIGLRVLIATAKNLQESKGKLAIAALNPLIFEVFRIAGFTRIFSIYPACDEAVAQLKNG